MDSNKVISLDLTTEIGPAVHLFKRALGPTIIPRDIIIMIPNYKKVSSIEIILYINRKAVINNKVYALNYDPDITIRTFKFGAITFEYIGPAALHKLHKMQHYTRLANKYLVLTPIKWNSYD